MKIVDDATCASSVDKNTITAFEFLASLISKQAIYKLYFEFALISYQDTKGVKSSPHTTFFSILFTKTKTEVS